MSDKKLEYLRIVHEKQEIYKRILDGAEMVKKGGIEGIQHVAQTNPEVLLIAFESLTRLVENQQKEHLSLIEDYFALLDITDKLVPPA